MALNAYLTLKAAHAGDIHGSVTQKGRENSIMVIAVNHRIVSPTDAASGQASGKRVHSPFVITKELDKSSPLLYQALCTNETITAWTLKFWTAQTKAVAGGGSEVQHFTVSLTNARICSIDFQQPNTKHPDLVKLGDFEEVGFAYQKIEWTWMDGGISFTDDWESPQ